MSIAYKCDRCGELFLYNGCNDIYRGHIRVEKNKPTIIMQRNNDKRDPIDLCPKCVSSFGDWFVFER